ncbi:class I SAM-dependent methyltransferase [Candidatus Gottesmanbacteria bacterium]|nr:class I SAM-dependent methyltransferase [Candidatus Gottesmanbacteria bacterium]
MMTIRDLEIIWNQVPPGYYEQGIVKNFLQKLWHERKWTILRKMINKNYHHILDIGCASGWLTARVAEILPKSVVSGVDVSRKMIRYAQERHPGIDFIYADAHHLPFANDYFDLIICTETLEHVVDPLRVLSEIRRCLRFDGEAIISMDTSSPLFKLIWFFWVKTKGKVWDNAHLHEFNKAELKDFFKKAKLGIKEEKISHLGMEMTFKLTKISR